MDAENNSQTTDAMTIQTVTVDGTQVHVDMQGQGTALVLIHGAGGNTRDWSYSMAGKLADRFRVIAIDRPGLGFTDRLPGAESVGESLAQQSDLIAATLDALGVARAVIAGQSYGGAVSLNFALRHPDKTAGLVVISGVSNPWTTKLDLWYRVNSTWLGQNIVIPVVSKITSPKIAEGVVTKIFEPDAVPPGYLDHMGLNLALRPTQMRANAQQINRLLGDIEAQYQRYGEINIPVEIIHGTEDEIVPLELHSAKLVDQIEGANLETLQGAGHMPQHSREAEVIAAIDRAAKRAGLR